MTCLQLELNATAAETTQLDQPHTRTRCSKPRATELFDMFQSVKRGARGVQGVSYAGGAAKFAATREAWRLPTGGAMI